MVFPVIIITFCCIHQPDDVLYVRKVPGAVTTIAIVAVAVAVVAVGVGVGATVYANKKSEEARKEMEEREIMEGSAGDSPDNPISVGI